MAPGGLTVETYRQGRRWWPARRVLFKPSLRLFHSRTFRECQAPYGSAMAFSGSVAPDICVGRPSRPRHSRATEGEQRRFCLLRPKTRHTDAPVAAEHVFGRPIQVQVEFAAGRAPYGDTTSSPGGMAARTLVVLVWPNWLCSPAVRGHGRRLAFWLPIWESTGWTVGPRRKRCKRL